MSSLVDVTTDLQPGTASSVTVPDLGRKVRTSLGWSLFNNALTRAASVMVGILVARLLVPDDFGLFAIALVALNALLSLNELGVSLTLVRSEEDPENIGPTVSTICVAAGFAWYLAAFLAAPFIASAMHRPEATGLLRVLCLSVIIDGLTAVPAALLTRTFRQDRRMLVDVTSMIASCGVTVTLALSGFGAWSLAWGLLAGNTVSGVLLYRLAPARYRPGWDARIARRVLRFGVPLAGSSLVVFVVVNADAIVVGRILGATALGYFVLAANLARWPVNVISTAVRRVALPAFSQIAAEPARISPVFSRSFSLLAAVTGLPCLVLATLSGPLITVVYGARWQPAAQVLALLAVVGATRVVLELAYDFLVAVGRTRTTFWLQVIWAVTLVPALVAGAYLGGLRGAALGSALVGVFIMIPAHLVAVTSAGVRWRDLGRELWVPLAAAGVGATVGLLLIGRLGSSLGALISGTAVVSAVYLVALTPLLLTVLGRFGGRRTAHAPA